MGVLQAPLHQLVNSRHAWMAHNWVLILSKLIRVLYTPTNPDHWRDIIGYATLVLDELAPTTNQTNEGD